MQRCSAGSCMTQYGHSHPGQWIFDKVGHTFVGWRRWVLFPRIKEIVWWWWLRVDRGLLRREGEGVCWAVLASSTDQHNDSLTVRQLEDPTPQRYLYIASRSWRERSTASLENMTGSTSCVLKLRWMILSPVFNANYHREFLSHTLHNGFSETGDLTYPRIRR